MTVWNSQIEPPPADVVERFSAPLADAIRNGGDVPSAVAELSLEQVGGNLTARRARIATLLTELHAEYRGFAEDLGVRKWRAEPFSRYAPAILSVQRSTRARPTASAAEMLADLSDIAGSSNGFVNRAAPARPLTAGDFTQRPNVTVPPYETGVAGSEAVAPASRELHA
jgi:hypothetical protein